MKKKNIAVKLVILAVALLLFLVGKASAAENELRFEGIRDTTIEAKSKFSTVAGIKAYNELGQEKGFSVYYRGKKISSSNYINTSKVTKRGQYHLLRYELRSGNKVKNIHRKIYIKDSVAPKFSGISNISVNYGSKFSTIKNVKATDNVDGKRGYSVYISKNKKWYKVSKKKYVNTKKAGKYYLKYVVKDKSGNATIKRRVVTVRPKPVKTTKKVVKKTTVKKASNTVYINPRKDNESGWWYAGLDKSRLFCHSMAGENLRNINVGTTVIIGGIPYKCRDKFLMWGSYPTYSGSSKAKEFRYVSRNGQYAYSNIQSASMYMQTCYNSNSQVLICLLEPTTSRVFGAKTSTIQVSNPQ